MFECTYITPFAEKLVYLDKSAKLQIPFMDQILY